MVKVEPVSSSCSKCTTDPNNALKIIDVQPFEIVKIFWDDTNFDSI